MWQELLLKLSFLAPMVIGEPTVSLKKGTVWFQEDIQGKALTPDQALQVFAEGRYQGPKPGGPNIGLNQKPHWFLVRVNNPRSTLQYVLNFDSQNLDEINLWVYNQKGRFEQPAQGDYRPLKNRSFEARSSNYLLSFPTGQDTLILYRVKTFSPLIATTSVETKKFYLSQRTKENALLWGVYGMIGVMALYHIFLAISLKSSLYSVYCIFLIFALVGQQSLQGHFHQVFLPNAPQYLDFVFVFSSFTFLLLYEFTIMFLDLKKQSRLSIGFIRFGEMIIFIYLAIYLISGFGAANRFSQMSGIVSPLILLGVGIAALRRGQKEARFFAVSFVSLIAGLVVHTLKQNGVIPLNLFTNFALVLGNGIQITLMAVALGDRMRLVEERAKEIEERKKAEEAKHKAEVLALNASLERRVAEQTRDIQLMLDHTRVGLFSITAHFTIHKDYARFLETILEEQQLGGKSFAPLVLAKADLGPDAKNRLMTALEYSFGESPLFFDVNRECLPREFAIDVRGKRKFLDLDWSEVLDDKGQIEKVLVSMRDVTENQKLRAEAEEGRKSLTYLSEVMSVGAERFEQFDQQAEEAWTEIHKITTHQRQEEGLPEMAVRKVYVILHTIKGVARSFKFGEMADRIHEAEESVAGKSILTRESLGTLEKSMKLLQECHERYRKAVQPILGLRQPHKEHGQNVV